MTPHPQADILLRIADGEDLTDRLWCRAKKGSGWLQCVFHGVLLSDSDSDWTFAISDEPGVPPPLPRPMIQLRKDGPKYYRGETVAPADDVEVWLARPAILNNSGRFADFYQRDESLRLGTVHLSEANYKLHMAALEDLMMWAHAGGVK